MTITIHVGDCREVLATLPDESVHCVVTSPPYFGLRCYGHPDQIGLEPTPDAYVAELVDVFREVRRVLRKDGTLWLNLGSSYASGDTSANRSRQHERDPSYDSDGIALEGLNGVDRACPDCGGELQACSLNHRESIAGNSQQNGSKQRRREKIDRDNGRQDCASVIRDASARNVQQSTISSSTANVSDVSGLADEVLVGQLEQPTFFDDAPVSAHSSACMSDTAQNDRPSSDRKWGKVFVCTACGYSTRMYPTFKPKDMIPIPWMIAMALQADGWYLRQDIIWCLSGGTRVYARTQKGEMPMTIKDLVRLDPSTVQLWNGEKWTQVLGWNETPRPDRTYEIELRSGQRIGCTAGHLWPTQRGNVRADEIRDGDIISTCRLPEPSTAKAPVSLENEIVGWFVGLYIAEGSRCDGTIQIASHTKEDDRFSRLAKLADAFHGSCAVHKTSENGCTVALNGPILNGIIDTYISGKIASDKHLHPRCWQRSNAFLRAVLGGYLSGDGHWDANNQRWRLGFTNNDELVADLRTLCARLGVSVRLKRHNHVFDNREFPGYRGEIRFERSDHHNSKNDGEVIAIRESRARKFWDIGVADEPHLFALASGVLTHNSKPNPMPESVRDRCTKAHEYLFLLSKSERYYYDADAIKEKGSANSHGGAPIAGGPKQAALGQQKGGVLGLPSDRNKRSVWEVTTQPFGEAHFATFPPDLIEPCILAGCPKGGTVLDPFGGAGTTGLVADRLGRNAILIELNPEYAEMARRRIQSDCPLFAEVS